MNQDSEASATDVAIWLARVLVVVICIGLLFGQVRKGAQYVLTCFINEPEIVIPAGISPTGETEPGRPPTLSTGLCSGVTLP